ncbi:MAG: hypothetical protein PVI57_16505 [Gemmatimonadota bacterium]|jgi:hypothetical protein
MRAGLVRGLVLVATLGVALPSCSDGPTAEDLLALRQEVDLLRDSLASTGRRPDALVAGARAARDEVVIGLRTEMVVEVLSAAASRYLSDVRLHLRDDVPVSAGDDVKVSLGLFDVTVGSWELDVTIERIDARLRADSILLSVPDSQRLAVTVPVRVLDGSGDAIIDFRWDASRVTSVVCGDFAIRERFSGTVEPRVHRVEGYFQLEVDSAGVRAVPILSERMSVSPRPTEAAWDRVRAILADQDRIFNCGLAISKEDMEARLRELLERGFRFDLPRSLLRPAPLPASVVDRVEVAGRSIGVTVESRPPRLDPDWVWLAARVGVEGRPGG